MKERKIYLADKLKYFSICVQSLVKLDCESASQIDQPLYIVWKCPNDDNMEKIDWIYSVVLPVNCQ